MLSTASLARAVLNSALLGPLAATIVVGLTLVSGWLVVLGRAPARWLLDLLATLPLALPGLVLGMALLRLSVGSALHSRHQYDPAAGLLHSLSADRNPLQLRRSAGPAPGADWPECSRVLGATWLQTTRRIVVPLLLPALAAGWAYVLLLSIREVSTVVLLFRTGNRSGRRDHLGSVAERPGGPVGSVQPAADDGPGPAVLRGSTSWARRTGRASEGDERGHGGEGRGDEGRQGGLPLPGSGWVGGAVGFSGSCVPAGGVVEDVLTVAGERRFVANDVLVEVALPETTGEGRPTLGCNTVTVAGRGKRFESLHDIGERHRRQVTGQGRPLCLPSSPRTISPCLPSRVDRSSCGMGTDLSSASQLGSALAGRSGQARGPAPTDAAS